MTKKEGLFIVVFTWKKFKKASSDEDMLVERERLMTGGIKK